MARKTTVYSGAVFGRLTVVSNTNGRWLCMCSCGKTITVHSKVLTTNHTRSCGCLRAESARKNIAKTLVGRKAGKAFVNQQFSTYQQRASRRHIEFDLTLDVFLSLVRRACHYCNSSPQARFNKKAACGVYVSNGIDRIDSSIGYRLDNCVPCCRRCNLAKNSMGYYEFLEWVAGVYENIAQVPSYRSL